MNLKLLAASAALVFISAPASAQLLGGGLGGNLGGNLGGTLGGIGSGLGRDAGSTTTGTLSGSASGRAERNANVRSGRVGGRAGAEGALGGGLDSVTPSTLGSGGASANGSGRASNEVGFNVQGVGTDGIGSIVGGVVDTAAGAAGSLRAPSLGGDGAASANELGSGSGQASGGFGLLDLAAAGSAAANAAGTVAVEPGMLVRDASGRAIGEVQRLRTTANGLVDTVIVEVGNRLAALPASNFTVSGDTLVSAMSRGEVRRQAQNTD